MLILYNINNPIIDHQVIFSINVLNFILHAYHLAYTKQIINKNAFQHDTYHLLGNCVCFLF